MVATFLTDHVLISAYATDSGSVNVYKYINEICKLGTNQIVINSSSLSRSGTQCNGCAYTKFESLAKPKKQNNH